MSGLGIDYEGAIDAPTLTSGAALMPGTLVVAEVRPNWVTVEGADGLTSTAVSGGDAAGVGQVGEWVTYSYVLDQPTLDDIAATRLASNISSIAASVEVAASARYRPWIDYYVGDRIWVDIGAGLPAGWYRVEKIAMRLDVEASGARYVVDVGRAVITEDAAVADRLAAILYAGLIDTDTGLVTAGNTGQATTTVIIQSDAIPAHSHTLSDVTDWNANVGGDVTGTLAATKVERWRGYELASTPAPDEGATLLWDDANEIAEWSRPPVQHAYTFAGDLEVGSGTFRLPIIRDLHIVGCYVTIATAPTGQAAIFDVNVNGTSIYATTPANRPTVADAANASQSPPPIPDTTAVSAGDYITVDVDQIGSTVVGANAVLVIEFGRNRG